MSSAQTTLPRLVYLPVSPWSERARWALDHHQIHCRAIEHVPFLGERRLRRLVGKKGGHATVPALLLGDRALTESWDIEDLATEMADLIEWRNGLYELYRGRPAE